MVANVEENVAFIQLHELMVKKLVKRNQTVIVLLVVDLVYVWFLKRNNILFFFLFFLKIYVQICICLFECRIYRINNIYIHTYSILIIF